jgi:F-type H+-transporting ATPase subunit b
MEQTLSALGGILVRAIPTFLLVLVLYLYLKRIIFRPLDSVLSQRFQATEGARQAAAAGREEASRKASEYAAALSSARADIYRMQELERKQLRDQQAGAVREWRERSDAAVKEARRQLDAEVESLQRSLAAETETLALEIAQAALGGRRS